MTPTILSDQRQLWQDRSQIPYHAAQFDRMYRSTDQFGRFLQSLGIRGDRALDLGCGAGANIYHLSRIFPQMRWVGVDIAGDLLFPIGRPRLRERGIDATLIAGDFYTLDEILPGESYDLVISMQTLSWLPNYEEALEQAMSVTRGWLVISSLFTDFDADVEISAHDHVVQPELPPYNMRVLGIRRFRERCYASGCRDFVAQDFQIDIDLPVPESNGLGTYTRRLADGQRLQFTGPIFLPWKFVAVRMGD